MKYPIIARNEKEGRLAVITATTIKFYKLDYEVKETNGLDELQMLLGNNYVVINKVENSVLFNQ